MITNDEILKALEDRCEEVEYVGRVNLVDEERRDRINRTHYGITDEERWYQTETHRISRQRARIVLEDIRCICGISRGTHPLARAALLTILHGRCGRHLRIRDMERKVDAQTNTRSGV